MRIKPTLKYGRVTTACADIRSRAKLARHCVSLCGHVLEGGEHIALLQQARGGAEADEPHELLSVAATHGEHCIAARAVQVRVACICGKQGRSPYGRPIRAYLPTGRGWPRLEVALSLVWRWRGVSKLEGELADAPGRLFSA